MIGSNTRWFKGTKYNRGKKQTNKYENWRFQEKTNLNGSEHDWWEHYIRNKEVLEKMKSALFEKIQYNNKNRTNVNCNCFYTCDTWCPHTQTLCESKDGKLNTCRKTAVDVQSGHEKARMSKSKSSVDQIRQITMDGIERCWISISVGLGKRKKNNFVWVYQQCTYVCKKKAISSVCSKKSSGHIS